MKGLGARRQGLRVLLIHPPCPPHVNVARDYAGGYGTAIRSERDRYGSDPTYMCVPYVSLLFTAALIEAAGHEVILVDGQAEDLSAARLVQRVADLRPDLVVGVVSLPTIEQDLALYRAVRTACEGAFFAAIGTVCSGLPGEVLGQGVFDAAVIGDAEVVIPELCDVLVRRVRFATEARQPLAAGDSWRRARGLVFLSGCRMVFSPRASRLSSLDAVPMPAYHLAPMPAYSHRFPGMSDKGGLRRYALALTSRGCAARCSHYCPYPFGFGTRLLLRSPEFVAAEVAELASRYGVSAVLFRDQNFAISRGHAEQVCELLARQAAGVEWMCETRFDSVDPVLLRRMRAAGCRQVNYGLEMADPSLLATVGKPGCTIEQAVTAVRAARDAGIAVHLHCMVGWPDDDLRTTASWERLLRRLAPDRVGVSVLTPYPGTSFREQAISEGLLETSDWSRYTGFEPVMRTRHLSPAQVRALRDSVAEDWSRPSLTVRAVGKAAAMAGRAFVQAVPWK